MILCACRVGGWLPSSRTRFVFSVCRLVSRRCHAISSILGCPTRPSQNRACAIYAHGSSHCRSLAIITGWFPVDARSRVSSQPREASPQQLHVHQMKQTVEHNSGSLRALRAMRCNFVATGSPRLGAADVSSHRSTMCHLLSSGGIARPRWYYEMIRLPMRDKRRLPFTVVGTLSHPWKHT